MGSIFINGATYAVSTTLGAAVPVTALTNADPAVATAAAPPPDGSIVVVKSGWPELSETVARTASASTDSFELEEIDTSDVVRFPAGEGVGSVRVAGGFSSLSQVRNVEMPGGEQQFFQFQYVEDRSGRQRQKPTFKNAMSMVITLDYDPDLTWYQILIDLDARREPIVLRETLPNGALIYYYAYPSFNKVPTKTINENIVVTATFSLIADPIRYAA